MGASENQIKEMIGKSVQENALSNDSLISIIELCGSYLNLKTIPNYAKSEGISYNGTLNRIKLNKIQERVIFGNRMIIDNE